MKGEGRGVGRWDVGSCLAVKDGCSLSQELHDVTVKHRASDERLSRVCVSRGSLK